MTITEMRNQFRILKTDAKRLGYPWDFDRACIEEMNKSFSMDMTPEDWVEGARRVREGWITEIWDRRSDMEEETF